MEDIELLREYARTRSETAFRELTRRYVNLVYSSALRQLRDRSLAQDVTQATFLVLARKAHRLSPEVPLSSWLLTVTRFAAKDAIKSESRRKRHEQKAAAMNPETTDAKIQNSGEAGWEEVAPLLDQAVTSLNRGSRSAIVLRYFEQKSYRQVAEVMGITEAAARQRVSQAIEQLRSYFTSRNVTLSLASLKVMIRSNAVIPAPNTVAQTAASIATKGVAISARHAAMAHAASLALIPASVKWGAVAATVLVVTATGVLLYRAAGTGYSATIAAKAVNPSSINGTVVTPDGKPVEGAEVMLAQSSAPVAAYGVQRDNVLAVRTGADGSFELPRRPDATALVARADQGYAQVLLDPSNPPPGRIVLSPWARIEGMLRVGGKIRSDQTVELVRTGSKSDDWDRWHVMHEVRVKTGILGKFVFPRVIGLPKDDPHGSAICWTPPETPGQARYFDLRVQPGETLNVVLGGDGITLHGKVAGAGPNLPPFSGTLLRAATQSTRPARIPATTEQPIAFRVAPDGSFEIDDVPPGEYDLDLHSVMQWPGSRMGEVVAFVRKSVTVPAEAVALKKTVEVGELTVPANPTLMPGDRAPDFSAIATDGGGEEINLASFRGKLLLLYVSGGGQQDRAGTLKPVFDRFGGDPRFAMLELNSDSLQARLRRLGHHEVVPWKVANWHPTPSARPSAATQPAANDEFYRTSAHRLFLIDPEGRLLTKCWNEQDAYTAIDHALPRSTASGANSRVRVERVTDPHADHAGPFRTLPNPTETNNVARKASFSIVDGVIGRLGANTNVLNDGFLPHGPDLPRSNFCFDWGTLEGRLLVDLGQSVPVGQINTYSWHRAERGPQVYTLFGSDGAAPNFDPHPKIGTDPTRCGWTRIADVDTRPPARPYGGRYAVSISGAGPALGTYRYLLMEAFVTECDDDWGHTFFSEIDVIRTPDAKP